MSYSVTVLLLNGRRQKVSVKQTTSILSILEEVCSKNKLNADEYDLKWHKRILDATSTIQFSAIPNNSQLEIVPIEKRREELDVEIILQLETGPRLSGKFHPSSCIREIIDKLCDNDVKSKANPVVIYARQEISGDKLNSTTLKHLGLTSGNALLRLLHRSEDQLHNQASSSVYNLPSKPKLEDTDKIPRRKEGSLQDFAKDEKLVVIDHRDDTESIENKIAETKTDQNQTPTVQSDVEKMDVDNSVTVSHTPEITENEDIDSMPMQAFENISTPSEPKIPFDINSVEYLGERYALIYHSDEMKSPKFTNDESDTFYQFDKNDAAKVIEDHKKIVAELESGRELETSKSKETKQSIKLERTISIYPYSVVRIIFPNRLVLQGIFQSTETIEEVNRFVRSFLHPSIEEFELFTAVVRATYEPNQTLVLINAVPGINLHIGFFGKNVTEYTGGSYFKESCCEKITPAATVNEVSNHFRQRLPSPEQSSLPITRNTPIASTSVRSSNTPQAGPSTSHRSNRNPSNSEKIPKWFKPK